ncbi:MAG: alpha/beta family hydrolase [Microthrixaceae bacterium]
MNLAIERLAAPLPVWRMNFPYRDRGSKGPPDREVVLLESLDDAFTRLCRDLATVPSRVVIGGRSLGGRMCSMAVARGLGAAGLVALSYPLHPPGRPDRLRLDHLSEIAVPCLFVSGRRDPFGSPEELEAATATIPGRVTHRWVEGGHDPKGVDEEIATQVRDWLSTTFVTTPRRVSSAAPRRPTSLGP